MRPELESLLNQYQLEWRNQKSLSFEALNTIHFCRWVILDTMVTGDVQIPERLVFASNFDGDSKTEHIEQLCRVSADMLDKIYFHCEGYPEPEKLTPESRVQYFTQRIHPTKVFFAGAQLRSLDRIRAESNLRNRLRKFLDSKDFTGNSARQVHAELQKYIESTPDLAWAKKKAKIPGINFPALLLFVIIMIPLLPFVILMILGLRIFYERKEVPLGLEPGEVPLSHMNKLEENEDFVFQNQFSQVLIMKPGWLRKIALQFSLTLTQFLGKNFFDQGLLMGIPTIHFARWIMMDDNKNMLFLSNFDGSWQQYLGDFIDKSGWGLTGIYGASVGFPKSYFMFFGGAYNEEQFLAWSRYYQIPTQFWYSAYTNLSIKNIINNSLIRRDLSRNLSENSAFKFLQRI